ncbi:hypothetical protein [Sphaerisporangium fuscum]|uniref:hypothetical protein n=1 Tax=Sphaerisporangium fuscum TaxID=2835868 RepID=UPI003558A265
MSIDGGAHLDGWTGDAAISFTIGAARREDTELIEAAERALRAGIRAPGAPVRPPGAPLSRPRAAPAGG